MNSGIYIRVGKENKLLEEMTIEERKEWLDSLNKEALYRVIDRLCEELLLYEKYLDKENNKTKEVMPVEELEEYEPKNMAEQEYQDWFWD